MPLLIRTNHSCEKCENVLTPITAYIDSISHLLNMDKMFIDNHNINNKLFKLEYGNLESIVFTINIYCRSLVESICLYLLNKKGVDLSKETYPVKYFFEDNSSKKERKPISGFISDNSCNEKKFIDCSKYIRNNYLHGHQKDKVKSNGIYSSFNISLIDNDLRDAMKPLLTEGEFEKLNLSQQIMLCYTKVFDFILNEISIFKDGNFESLNERLNKLEKTVCVKKIEDIEEIIDYFKQTQSKYSINLSCKPINNKPHL